METFIVHKENREHGNKAGTYFLMIYDLIIRLIKLIRSTVVSMYVCVWRRQNYTYPGSL